MKFKTNSAKLQEMLQNAQRFIAPKPVTPIYSHIMLKTENGILSVTGTDTVNTIVSKTKVTEAEDGEILIEAKYLPEVVRELRDKQITVITEGNKITVLTDNGKYNFMGQKPEGYQTPEKINDENATKFRIKGKTLSEAIEKTIYATSDDNNLHPIMCGINIEIPEDGKIRMTATDGHRMAMTEQRAEAKKAEGGVLEKKAAQILKAVSAKEENDVEMTMDGKNIQARFKDKMLTMRRIIGKYPNCENIIPKENPIKVRAEREKLISALKKIQTCSNRNSGMVKLIFWKDMLKMKGQDIDFATAGEETMECKYPGTDKFEIAFKSTMMIEALTVAGTEKVTIEMSANNRPGLIREDKEEGNGLALLMPMMEQ